MNDNLPIAEPTSATATRLPRAPLSREHIVVREVVARLPEDRPPRDTIDGIAEWLVGPARHIVSGIASFDEFAWRLLAAGLPLLRVTLHVGTIHPQFLGTTIVGWRDIGKTTQVMIGHEVGDAIPFAGQIRRGTGVELTAVLWSSDLRGFTERSDRLPGNRMIEILNTLFDAQAIAIRDRGGEILKFIGDGILAVFPIEDMATIPSVARDAVAAAHTALAAVRRLVGDPAMADEPPLEIVVALHIGTVSYGNIGAADRLDFTVIGPAVNLVSRIEGVAKALDRPILVSSDFARALGDGLVSVGLHHLRGLAMPRELFAPA